MSRKGTSDKPSSKKKGKVEVEAVHHPFDSQFLTEYANLLTMLIERGYEMGGMLGVKVYIPTEGFEYTDEDREDGIVKGSGNIYYKVSIDPIKTQRKLTEKYGGLEAFSLRLHHIDTRLDMLVFYLLAEAESGSATERKQLSEDHVKRYVDIFDREQSINRLLLITRVKPSADALTIINNANNMLRASKPLCLVRLIPSTFFYFNPARWFLQPKEFVIHRDEERETLLEELDVPPHLKGKEDSLLPYMSENDPLALYYGAAVNDVVSFVRAEPRTVYVRLIVPDFDTQF